MESDSHRLKCLQNRSFTIFEANFVLKFSVIFALGYIGLMCLLDLTKATTNSAVIGEYIVTTTIASIPVTLSIVVFVITVSISDKF
jgi:hypothetical protein